MQEKREGQKIGVIAKKMPELFLYTSNRLEILSEKLAEVLSKPLASPLQREIILVQSRGREVEAGT